MKKNNFYRCPLFTKIKSMDFSEEELLKILNETKHIEEKLAILYLRPSFLKTKTFSPEWIKVLLSNNGNIINHVSEPSEEMKFTAIKQNPNSIQFIKKTSYRLWEKALKAHGLALMHLYKNCNHFTKNELFNLARIAIKSSPQSIKFVNDPPLELKKLAIKHDPFSIQYMDKQSLALCKQAFNQNITTFKFLKYHTQKMQLIAINKYPLYLRYIKNPSINICWKALRKNVAAIQDIPKQSDKMWFFIFKKKAYYLFRYYKGQNPAIINYALNDYSNIQYITNPSEFQCYIALKQNPYTVRYLKNHCPLEISKKYNLKLENIIYNYKGQEIEPVIVKKILENESLTNDYLLLLIQQPNYKIHFNLIKQHKNWINISKQIQNAILF